MPRRAASKPKPASQASPAAPLTLGASCTLREAVELRKSLLEAATGAQGIAVDGAAVRRIDAAGLQLLVALALREKRAGRPMRWLIASDELLAASSRAGLGSVLGLDAQGAA